MSRFFVILFGGLLGLDLISILIVAILWTIDVPINEDGAGLLFALTIPFGVATGISGMAYSDYKDSGGR